MIHGTVHTHTECILLGDTVMDTLDGMILFITEAITLLGGIVDGIHHFTADGTIHGITEDMDMVVTMEAITVVVTDMDIVVVSVMDTTQDLLIIGQVEVQVFTDHLQVEDPAMLLVLQDEQVLHQAV